MSVDGEEGSLTFEEFLDQRLPALLRYATVITCDPHLAEDIVQIAALPPRQRGVVALRYYEGNSDAEIAALLGCSEVTVRSHCTSQTPECAPQRSSGAYRADLPTDADAMLAYLNQQTPARPASDGPREAWLFGTAADLIRERYVPPAALAALFGAMARIHGITVTHDVVDAAGRSGVSVGYEHRGYRNELLFDPRTYAYLANRSVAVRDVDGVPKGTVSYQEAQLRIAIVDKPGQSPG
jgi:hypothetical protein